MEYYKILRALHIDILNYLEWMPILFCFQQLSEGYLNILRIC